jgi:hypothetical protein
MFTLKCVSNVAPFHSNASVLGLRATLYDVFRALQPSASGNDATQQAEESICRGQEETIQQHHVAARCFRRPGLRLRGCARPVDGRCLKQ